MKNSAKLLFIIPLISILVFTNCNDDNNDDDSPIPQPDWVKVELDSIPHLFNDVTFDANGTNGWIVGDAGTFLSTNDAGQSWEIRNELTTQNLNKIFFLNANHMWIVGNNGTILFSGNNGETWQPQSCPTEGNLNSVFFVDDNNGWIVGTSEENPSLILHTANGGTGSGGWNFQDPPENNHALNDLFFPEKNIGYVVGNSGTVFETKDGGFLWEKANQVSYRNIYSVYFIDDNTGFAVGAEGEFINRGKESNSGDYIWWLTNEIPNYSFTTFDLYSIMFVDENKGWCGGEKSGIFKTVNGATSWSGEYISEIVDIYDIYIDVNESGWAVGRNYIDDSPVLLKYDPKD